MMKNVALVSVGVGLLLQLCCLQVDTVNLSDAVEKEAAKEEAHSFTIGKLGPGDKLLYVDHPKHSYKLLRIASTDIKFPPKNVYAKGIITFIRVTDLKEKGKGGYAYLDKGGVGYKYAHFHIKSQRNHGYDFLVEVYGDTY